MKARIQKWGDNLAIRIPAVFAAEAGLKDNAEIELSFSSGRLFVTPVDPRSTALEDLLARITADNLHSEFDTDKPIGNEAW